MITDGQIKIIEPVFFATNKDDPQAQASRCLMRLRSASGRQEHQEGARRGTHRQPWQSGLQP